MEVKYELEVKLLVKVDDVELSDIYTENGEGPCGDITEAVDMFVKPRIDAAGFVLARRIKKNINRKLGGN